MIISEDQSEIQDDPPHQNYPSTNPLDHPTTIESIASADYGRIRDYFDHSTKSTSLNKIIINEDKDSLYKSWYQKIYNYYVHKNKTTHIFYLCDFMMNIYLVFLTANQFNTKKYLGICALTIITSYFSTANRFPEEKGINIGVWMVLLICCLISESFLMPYIHIAIKTGEVGILYLIFCGQFSLLLISIAYVTTRKGKLKESFVTHFLLTEFSLLFFPLYALYFYKYITIYSYLFMVAVSLILIGVYSRLGFIVKDKEERINVRCLFYKNMLVFHVFLEVYYVVQLEKKLGGAL